MAEAMVIEFHLDARSGVAPYLQLIHQVRHALRLGLLSEGDQLPTVKDVVERLAINPNTVLKAYRELEYEGLAADRARRREHRGPVRRHVSVRQTGRARGGHSMTAVLETCGLGKQYRRRWALADCTLDIPSGRVVGLVGPNGAGKTTLLHLAVGMLAPTAGTIEVLGSSPAGSRAQLARVG